ncbi:MAG: MMPL family transporter [Candidatus Binatia bacterium]
MRQVIDLVVRFPRIFVFCALVLTAWLGSLASQVRLEGSLESVLPARDPAVEYYTEVRSTFGSDDIAVVGVRAPDLFAETTLAKLKRVTERLASIEGVERVLSVTNAVDVAADVFDPPPLLPHIPPSAAEVAVLKEKLAATPLYARNLVAPDLRGAAINVFLGNLSDEEYADFGIDQKIQAVLAAEEGPEQFYFAGPGHVKHAAVALMRSDLARFTPLALVLVAVILWFSFRRLRAVVLPLLAVVIAVVWTLGIMVLAGKSINIGTFVLPPLLLVIGSEYAIYVVSAFYEHAAQRDRSAALQRALRQVWPPLLISALTAAVGFGSLTANEITAIRELGLFSVIGIACLVASCLVLLPSALELWGQVAAGAPLPPARPVDNFMERLGSAAYRHRAAVLAAAGAIAVVALIGVSFIRVDSDFLTYFDESSEVRLDHEAINRHIVGSNPFYLVVEGGEPGALKRWDVLKLVKDLQNFLATLPGVTTSISLVDYLELLEKGLGAGSGDIVLDEHGRSIEGGAAPEPFWENPANLPPVLAVVSNSAATFRSVVTPDFARANIVVRTNLSGSREVEALLAKVREYTAQRFPDEIDVVPTGNLVLLTGTSSDIVAGQARSLTIALVVIFAVMAFMLLSVRVGLLAVLPNALAIAIFFGLLGWLGVHLNLGTSLIAVIALGIAVDSSIYYMSRFSRELRGESDQAAAMQRAMRAVGAPVLYTSLALFCGFLSFALSSFVPIRSFGVFSAVTLATAFAANLVVLPALLATTRLITLWDLVGLKLGEDPTRTIPLLAGLRPAQARIVVLMGQLRRFPLGAPIVRAGEQGAEMFVILSGITDVFVGHGAERRQVAELRRGDVFGEMGLVRDEVRSADVVAREPVEALAVDQRFLQRIQRRYPRIAARVFLNLTRILSDRLERMNRRIAGAVS